MALKVYEYANCDTCKKALKFLEQEGVAYERIPIVEQPPTVTELKRMVRFLQAGGGGFRNLFNTSGALYRELGVADRLKGGMKEEEALELLARNGKLIKRPFALSTRGGAVGFKEDAWKDLISGG